LLLSELWYDDQISTIGVIRNPVAVSHSLRRRDPKLRDGDCLELWEAYNTRLLALLARKPFPVIEFGGSRPITAQLTASLGFYGFRAEQSFRFFDRNVVRGTPDEHEWRSLVSPKLIALWDDILECAARV
jgi:hypothetical protein